MRSKSRLQIIGEEMTETYGFLGVPKNTFDRAGRMQFIALLREGLSPESTLLEIGCGVLRVSNWIIPFLNCNNYCGIEPAKERVEYGIKHLLTKDSVNLKNPRFDFNWEFNSSMFDTKFDFYLAGSIWSHASKDHIKIMLDDFVKNSSKMGVFLTSYFPAFSFFDDYKGKIWVGTSHESKISGVVRHSFIWIKSQCKKRGLVVTEISGEAFDSQIWLRIHKKGLHPNLQNLVENQNKFFPRVKQFFKNRIVKLEKRGSQS